MTTFKNPRKLSCERNSDPFGYFDCTLTTNVGKTVKFAADEFDMELVERRVPTPTEADAARKKFPYDRRGFGYAYPKGTSCTVSGAFRLDTRGGGKATIKKLSCRIPAVALT